MSEADQVLNQRFSVSDPYRSVPLYVSAVTISQDTVHKIMLVGFFSGMPIPSGPNEHTMQEGLVGAYALNVSQAQFLYQNLKQFLQSVGKEV